MRRRVCFSTGTSLFFPPVPLMHPQSPGGFPWSLRILPDAVLAPSEGLDRTPLSPHDLAYKGGRAFRMGTGAQNPTNDAPVRATYKSERLYGKQ